MQINHNLLDIENIKNSKLGLSELFIRRTAVITSVSESLVEKVVKDQWVNANLQTKIDSDVSEIDFTNLGSIRLSSAKCNKKIKTMSDINKYLTINLSKPDITDKYIEKANRMLLKNTETIKGLNRKLKNED